MSRIHLRLGPAALLALVVLAACSSGGGTPGTMTASSAWARPSTGMDRAAAAYVVITNGTGQADALVGASSPAAKTVEVHETTVGDSGMMAMKPVTSVPIPVGGTLELKPGSYHIMLIDLTSELKAGDTIQLTLTFAKAPPVTVTAEVRAS